MKLTEAQLRALIGEVLAEGKKKDPGASVKEFVKALKVVVKHAAAAHDYLNELAEQCQDDRLLLHVTMELEEAAGDIANMFLEGVGVDRLLKLETAVKLAKTASKEAKADGVTRRGAPRPKGVFAKSIDSFRKSGPAKKPNSGRFEGPALGFHKSSKSR